MKESHLELASDQVQEADPLQDIIPLQGLQQHAVLDPVLEALDDGRRRRAAWSSRGCR